MIFVICCATNIPKPTVYFMGINEEEFMEKNDGLELFEKNEVSVVYFRRECSECNPQYYTFMYGKLEAVSPFPISPNPMSFGFPPSTENTPKDSTDTN